MDFLTLFIAICVINSVLYFIDTIFKTCAHYPYIRFLNSTGLSIGLFRITLFTRVFNKTLQRWSSYKPKLLDFWFKFGVLATVFLLPVSITILIISIKNLLKSESFNGEDAGVTLEPMVPGINLPITDSSYYLFTIIICSIVHEMGHAIAALREDVHVSGIGFSAFLFVPIAYVKMNSDQLSALNPKRQLRIFCAGIWNNVALSVSAYSFLILLPFILSPVYDLGKGVTVIDVHQNSQIGGKTGVAIGDKLVAINDCEVSDTENWNQCLKSFNNKPAPGFCVNEDIIHDLDQSVPLSRAQIQLHEDCGVPDEVHRERGYDLSQIVHNDVRIVRMSEDATVECCDEHSDTHLCFETLDDGNPLQIPQYSCLPGRPVIAGTAYMCTTPKDCPPSLQCVRPVTPQGMTLLRIQRSQGNVVIFIGKPNNVLRMVDVSDYAKVFDLFPPRLAESVTKLTKYVIIFSSSIALINTIPCFYLDGNHITYAVVRYLLPRFYYKGLIGLIINIFGTCLLTINFSCLIWITIASYF